VRPEAQESKLRTIKQIAVTRLSLGVEHFDDEILSINGRAHKSRKLAGPISGLAMSVSRR